VASNELKAHTAFTLEEHALWLKHSQEHDLRIWWLRRGLAVNPTIMVAEGHKRSICVWCHSPMLENEDVRACPSCDSGSTK
jgi:hypothetical protein